MSITLQQISSHLLSSPEFISQLKEKVKEPVSISAPLFDNIIKELCELLEVLIRRIMQNQMGHLIADNNQILEQVRDNIEKHNSSKFIAKEETSFTQIHNLISQQKRRMLDQLNDAQVEKSMSILGQYDDFIDKVNQLTRKVKSMQDKYETNLKSLWNVLSMTESAVFDYIKQNRAKSQKQKQTTAQGKSVFSFWK